MYHIIFNGNEKYIPYICVCMTSIVRNTDENVSYKERGRTVLCAGNADEACEEAYRFHILTDFLSEETIQKINELEKQLKEIYPVSVELHFLDDRLFLDFPRWRKSFSAYYRIMAAQFLPLNVRRAVYLDGDTLVNTDIRAFMVQDLGGKTLAAVPNFPQLKHRLKCSKGEGEYSFERHFCYFNSGVMLIDMENWRKENIQEKVMRFLNAYQVLCPDQDALNAVFKDEVKILPYRWNLMWHNTVSPEKIKKKWKEQPEAFAGEGFYDGLDSPEIIHYSVKPWDSDGFRVADDYTFFYYPNLDLWWDMAKEVPVFAEELLAIRQSGPYRKMSANNKRKKFLLQFAWYRSLLKLKRDSRPFIRKIEKPFKTVRDIFYKYKRRKG